MTKEDFQGLVASMYMHYSGQQINFFYGGKYHTQAQALAELEKFDKTLAGKFKNIQAAQNELVDHVKHKLG